MQTVETRPVTDRGWRIEANSEEVKRQMFREMLYAARYFRRNKEHPMNWHTIRIYLNGMRRATHTFIFHEWSQEPEVEQPKTLECLACGTRFWHGEAESVGGEMACPSCWNTDMKGVR